MSLGDLESLNQSVINRENFSADVEMLFTENGNFNNCFYGCEYDQFPKHIESIPFCSELKSYCGLIVVDVQNDFTTGTMRTDACPAKENSKTIIPIINKLFSLPFTRVFTTRDFHPANHISFYENRNSWSFSDESIDPQNVNVRDVVQFIVRRGVKHNQILWPTHCVRDTWGCQLDSELKPSKSCIDIKKGTISDIECYSAFGDPDRIENTHLHEQLQEASIDLVIICGIAYDFCVAATALDAARLGYRVALVEDACVCIEKAGRAAKRQEMLEAGIYLTNSDKIPALITGEFIPLQHILQYLRKQQACAKQ